jgi:hypothetical protein
MELDAEYGEVVSRGLRVPPDKQCALSSDSGFAGWLLTENIGEDGYGMRV